MTQEHSIIRHTDLSNQGFLDMFAAPGRIGLVSGASFIDKAIRRAERHLTPEKKWSLWSHAILFQGKRADGHAWILESDLDARKKNIRLGVQENRVSKYYNEKEFTSVAVLTSGLPEEKVERLIGEGLELVAQGAKYSLREILGTYVAIHRPHTRDRKNRLAQDNAMYCSGFVQYVFNKIGLELVPGVHASRGTPEDIWLSPVPRVTYLLER